MILRRGRVARYAASIEELDDRQLVQASLHGDAEALDRLLRLHYGRIYALCRRMTGNDADAADAAQDALVAIARGLAAGRFDGRARFGTWAHRVTVNACLDELRRRKRRPGPLDGTDLEAGAPMTPAGPDLAEGTADRVDIDAALLHLPAELRAAVVLRDLCDLDYAAIAEVLEVPPGTVRSRIARGRATLAGLLGNPAAAPGRPRTEP